MMQSADGRAWEVLPPARLEFGDVPPRDHFEYGGCERIGGKYALIGGTNKYVSAGYSMYTLVADRATGPFRPDAEAYRLCGTSTERAGWGVQFLAAWARGNGELLISNYVAVPSGIWMLPLRKPVIDGGGHLRLGWWRNNNALKGKPIPLTKSDVRLTGAAAGGYGIDWLDEVFDLKKGVVLEGSIRADAAGGAPSGAVDCRAGFVLDETPTQAMAVLLGIGKPDGRETHIGRLTADATGARTFDCEDVTGKGCATVTGIGNGTGHSFRLLLRHDVFELYIDDLLMQTYVYRPASGKIGLLARTANAAFGHLSAWQMNL
jgi:hypothetical protein